MLGRVYLHYPFCSSYCRYCNFSAGAPPKEEYTAPYFEALLKEAVHKKNHLKSRLDSLYLGGGTPSLMPAPYLDKLFSFYGSFLDKNTEITLEINPETVSKSKAALWKSLGINRVSLGWQSMEDSTLKLLNRSGNASDNYQAFLLLREAGFENISVDRILSVHGDQGGSFFKALEICLPEHVSTYQLSIEERTVLHFWAQQGRYRVLADEDALAKEEECNQVLSALGYSRYEISNYARNGLIGQHNTAYWDYEFYLGLGSGASEFIPGGSHGIRRSNPFSFKDYLLDLPAEEEILSPLTAVKEALMVGLRKRAGINKAAFEKRLGICWDQLFAAPPDPQFFDDTSEALILKKEAIPLCNPAVLSLWGRINTKIFAE